MIYHRLAYLYIIRFKLFYFTNKSKMPKIKLTTYKKRKIKKNLIKEEEIRLIIDPTKRFKKLYTFANNYFHEKNMIEIAFIIIWLLICFTMLIKCRLYVT